MMKTVRDPIRVLACVARTDKGIRHGVALAQVGVITTTRARV
jgi:hypothetical protein